MEDVIILEGAYEVPSPKSFPQLGASTGIPGDEGGGRDVSMARVDAWFEIEALRKTLEITGSGGGEMRSDVGEIALDWVAAYGKRLRPILAASVAEALACRPASHIPGVASVAVAVECFHKASLIHDDIEDGDCERYGCPTLHERWGVPVALNTGDFLVGEGYRLISRSVDDPGTVVEMLRTAAECHGLLCVGQGDELLAAQAGALPLSVDETLAIFKRKTSPAFYAAAALGAMCAGVDGMILNALRVFCDFFGMAYQIKDDLDDVALKRERPPAPLLLSILSSVVVERGSASETGTVRAWINGGKGEDEALSVLRSPWVLGEAKRLMSACENDALMVLAELGNDSLARLLREMLVLALAP